MANEVFMESRLVRVVPQILDLDNPDQDMQEGLFSIDKETALKLDRNEMTVSPSPKVLRALKYSIDNGPLNWYSDTQSRRLRRKLSLYTGVNFDSIACYCNQAAVIETVIRTYLQPGLDALLSWPSDTSFSHYASSLGAKVIDAAFSDPFEPKIEEIITEITPKTRLIYLANPNAITGSTLTEAELIFLLAYAENSMIVVDESYFEFSGITAADLILKFSNLIIIRSFSKGFALAGFDTHYLMTDSRNFKFLNKLGFQKQPGTLAQTAAEAALEDLSYTAGIVRQVNESKRMIFDNLSSLSYDFRISPANFFLLTVADPHGLVASLAKKNIYINDLAGFRGFDNCVRITIGTNRQTIRLLEALAQCAPEQAIRPSTNRIAVRSANRPGLVRFQDETRPAKNRIGTQAVSY
jgi:histidinol-phosphate aminotransferase